MKYYRCDVCTYSVKYTDGKWYCCRYPTPTLIELPNNHRCGELLIDFEEAKLRWKQQEWRYWGEIRDLKSKHRKQIERLRAKYRNLKNSIKENNNGQSTKV